MALSMFLVQYGTKAFALPPSAVVAAAISDLRIKAETRKGPRRYAFAERHVRQACTPRELIKAALANPGEGLRSKHPNTRLLYSDPALLREALALAAPF